MDLGRVKMAAPEVEEYDFFSTVNLNFIFSYIFE